MDEWNLPAYKQARDSEGAAAATDDHDDETLLPGSEREHSDDEGEGGEKGTNDASSMGSRKSVKSTVWVILMTTGTLTARRILNGGFPYPFYYALLLQLGAYTCVAFVVLLARLKNFRSPKRKLHDEKYTWFEFIFMGLRVLLSSSIGAISILCGMQALLHFPNLPLLAMLPILTYVSDSFLFRTAYAVFLVPRGQSVSLGRVYRIAVIPICCFLAIFDDYRLNLRGLGVLLAGLALASLAKVVSRVGPKIESKGHRTWEAPLQIYLLAGIPPLLLAGLATQKYENVVAASAISRSWSILYRAMTLGPGVLLQIMFGSSILSAYPFISEDHAGGALEDTTEQAKDAVASTLQAGFWIFGIGVLSNETNFVSWLQVISFTVVYIVSVGPKHIAYYPPRMINLISRVIRRRSIAIHAEPWQFKFFLVSSTLIFAILVSTNSMFWIDTIAYNQNLKTWLGPNKLILDTLYRPPQLRSFDVVIAHMPGDPIEQITNLVNTYASHWSIGHLAPRVIVYTKDPSFNTTSHLTSTLKGNFNGELTVQTIHNTGGIAGTYLHHILYSWEFLPVQSLFLNTHTTTPQILPLMHRRFENYFISAGFPIPDALPKTGFLNLGEQETCWCGGCFDSIGWEDTFNLIPSMWSAARPGTTKCESVLLTFGNNFVTTAARIRGTKKEVWQLLYDALVNEDTTNAWAHAPEKIPKRLPGEGDKGRWAPGEVYGEKDSLQRPYLGFTVERLWGTLLQCSNGEVAWRCPTLERGWRNGGGKEDCGCVE